MTAPPDAPRPCCERIANGQWCWLETGHPGPHWSQAEPVYGPVEERPPMWRRHRGQNER